MKHQHTYYIPFIFSDETLTVTEPAAPAEVAPVVAALAESE
jgi:hypothetical protein